MPTNAKALVVEDLNLLRSIINSISTSLEIKEIVQSAGANLPSLFDILSFGVLWKEGPSLYLCEEESCPPTFTKEVQAQMAKVLSLLEEKPIDPSSIAIQVERRKWRDEKERRSSRPTLRSHITLPLAVEGELIGCISVNSDRPDAFNVRELQLFSVIGYQMAATLRHFQRFRSVKDLALFDTLTNLYNRRYFEERLGIETKKCFYGGSPLSLIMVDIDHFKKVNDTFGHTEGDRVLREISSLLRASIRKKDIVARYGGEEFILILPEASLEESFTIAERIRRTVEATPFEVAKVRLHLTVSLGISHFPSHRPSSKEELVRMADEALYEAKRAGRNRVCFYQAGAKGERPRI